MYCVRMKRSPISNAARMNNLQTEEVYRTDKPVFAAKYFFPADCVVLLVVAGIADEITVVQNAIYYICSGCR